MTNKNKDITIFQKMTELSVKHNSINLGQGFPDEDGPSDIIDKAAESLNKISNQYPPYQFSAIFFEMHHFLQLPLHQLYF